PRSRRDKLHLVARFQRTAPAHRLVIEHELQLAAESVREGDRARQTILGPAAPEQLPLLLPARFEGYPIQEKPNAIARSLDIYRPALLEVVERGQLPAAPYSCLLGFDEAIGAFRWRQRQLVAAADRERYPGAVHVLLAEFVGEHGDGDRLLGAIGLE